MSYEFSEDGLVESATQQVLEENEKENAIFKITKKFKALNEAINEYLSMRFPLK